MAKEDYRRLERKSHKLFKCEIYIVLSLALVVSIVTSITSMFDSFYVNWINAVIDLILLGLNAVILRSAISQNLTFFHKLYRSHRYEFHRHIKRELAK